MTLFSDDKMDKFDGEGKKLKTFIECDCHDCGMLCRGIDVFYEEFSGSKAIVWFSIMNGHKSGKPSLWQRIKDAWQFIRGDKVYDAEIVLKKEELEKLSAFCSDALSRWPTLENYVEAPTLDQLYDEIYREDQLNYRIAALEKQVEKLKAE